MKKKTFKVGQRRSWKSNAYEGRGKVTEIVPTAKGPYIRLETRDHPKGSVCVRESQVW